MQLLLRCLNQCRYRPPFIGQISKAHLLPPHEAVLLASVDVADHHLPPDATVWLRPTVDGVAEPAWRLPDEDR